MAELKGKFITLSCFLMPDDAKAKADEILEEITGLKHDEMDPEEFYDSTLWEETFKVLREVSSDPKQAVINVGRRVYPTIKRTMGMPPHLVTPLDFVRFEAEGFLANHRGDDVIPRKIISEGNNEITMYAPAPGYDENIYIGVWLGILEMIGITTGQVEELGNHTYRIHW